MDKVEIPLNIIKEKVSLSLPHDTDIDNGALVALNKSLNLFLGHLSNKIKISFSKNLDKKVMIKDLKECIESNPEFECLLKLLDTMKNS